MLAAENRSGTARWFYDWQGLLSAATTVVLVVVTFVYVLLTRRLSQASEQGVDVAQRGVVAAQDALALDRARWEADHAKPRADPGETRVLCLHGRHAVCEH